MKKGAFTLSIEDIQAIPKLITLYFVVFVILIGVLMFYSRDIDAKKSESQTLFMRLLYSKNCAAYNDGLRTYPGIIDLGKFTEENLNKCYAVKDTLVGLNFILKDFTGNIVKEAKLSDISVDLCDIPTKNFDCVKLDPVYVLYFNEGIKKGGIVSSTVILKHE
ncbi:MAG TPA: hypothetical protein VJH20_02805 [Candidatus Nanoarchaeia archaeon]|nr:hypothetical protein [Candidatus Nanoarchaeia archaeon]